MSIISKITDVGNKAVTQIQLTSPGAAAGSFLLGRNTGIDVGPYGTAGDLDRRTSGFVSRSAVDATTSSIPGANLTPDLPDESTIKLVVGVILALGAMVAAGQLFTIEL